MSLFVTGIKLRGCLEKVIRPLPCLSLFYKICVGNPGSAETTEGLVVYRVVKLSQRAPTYTLARSCREACRKNLIRMLYWFRS